MNADAMLLARVTGSLLVVVLLAVLAARFARRAGRGRGGGDLQVCERVGLSRETAAVVLETGGRRLLVGVGPAQVTLLADLSQGVPPAPQPATPTTGTLSRKAIRQLDSRRRVAVPPTQRGSGSVLDPRTWQQGVEALRDLTARRG